MANFYAQYPASSASSNASVGSNGLTAPTSSTEIGYIDGSGNLQPVTPTNPLPVDISSNLPNPLPVQDAAAEASLASIDTKVSTATNQTTGITALNAFSAKSASAFINVPFDETVITYVGASTNIDTVVYKLATVTVNTLTMSYDGSNRLSGVVKT